MYVVQSMVTPKCIFYTKYWHNHKQLTKVQLPPILDKNIQLGRLTLPYGHSQLTNVDTDWIGSEWVIKIRPFLL